MHTSAFFRNRSERESNNRWTGTFKKDDFIDITEVAREEGFRLTVLLNSTIWKDIRQDPNDFRDHNDAYIRCFVKQAFKAYKRCCKLDLLKTEFRVFLPISLKRKLYEKNTYSLCFGLDENVVAIDFS